MALTERQKSAKRALKKITERIRIHTNTHIVTVGVCAVFILFNTYKGWFVATLPWYFIYYFHHTLYVRSMKYLKFYKKHAYMDSITMTTDETIAQYRGR